MMLQNMTPKGQEQQQQQQQQQPRLKSSTWCLCPRTSRATMCWLQMASSAWTNWFMSQEPWKTLRRLSGHRMPTVRSIKSRHWGIFLRWLCQSQICPGCCQCHSPGTLPMYIMNVVVLIYQVCAALSDMQGHVYDIYLKVGLVFQCVLFLCMFQARMQGGVGSPPPPPLFSHWQTQKHRPIVLLEATSYYFGVTTHFALQDRAMSSSSVHWNLSADTL